MAGLVSQSPHWKAFLVTEQDLVQALYPPLLGSYLGSPSETAGSFHCIRLLSHCSDEASRSAFHPAQLPHAWLAYAPK